MKKTNKNLRIFLLVFLLVVLAASAFQFFGTGGGKITNEEVPFSEFVQKLDQGKVKEVAIDDTKIVGKLSDTEIIYAYASSLSEMTIYNEDVLKPLVKEGKIKETNEAPGSGEWILNALPTVLMIGSLIFLFWFIMNQGGNGKAFSFGKNKAKMVKNDKNVTFKDVAGLDEEKQELEEVVDFLKNPKKYKDLGARIPKGILLVGPPGTGKTYLSKATAGEAGVPFFTISGSDFVEMFVGVGASRVRELFAEAKKNNPCIVFIDEIDAVGRKRGAGIGGGHDEREQTLNQLLVEMDGFGENSGVIVLAATNRPDILDPALLRPGRFDRQVVIGIPDVKGREEIFKIHSKNKPLSDEVSPKILARRTPGFTPADIENLLNEAALITARRSGQYIRMDEIEEAITKVIAGPEKKSKVISEKERKLTAYHEAGHAVVAEVLPTCDPVHQVTIIPRGRAGGFTMTLPEDDKSYQTRGDMNEEIIELLAGRAAEALKLDDISTGASNDIQRATDIARDMVTKYGFSSRIGTVNYAESEEVFLGNDFSSKKNYSEEMAKEIDQEIKDIINKCYAESEKILSDNNDKLVRVAEGLLLVETLDGDQFKRLYNGEITPEELAAEVEEKTKEIEKQNKKEAKQRRKQEEEEEARREEEYQKFREERMSVPEDAGPEQEEAARQIALQIMEMEKAMGKQNPKPKKLEKKAGAKKTITKKTTAKKPVTKTATKKSTSKTTKKDDSAK